MILTYAIQELKQVALALPGVDYAISRPVKELDANRTLGIAAAEWTPAGNAEIGGSMGPSNGRYEIECQILIKSFDQEEGHAELVETANTLRQAVFLDRDMHVRLGELAYANYERIEKFQKIGVNRITYLSNKIKTEFLHMAILEIWVETETC